MSALHDVPVSDFTFGNGWIPGSGRRIVVKEDDHTWNIGRSERTISITSAIGVAILITMLGTLLQLSQ
ncbi:hypothetical protein GGF37_001816 [Kickxella alabastrina]|nr:hypothetical protein GGF37_001816 [Kickxella alabastrina]